MIYPPKLTYLLILLSTVQLQLKLSSNIFFLYVFEKLCRKISSSSRILQSVCPLFPGYWKWLPSKMTPFHDEVGQIKWVNCNILLPRMKCMYRVPQVEKDIFGTNRLYYLIKHVWKTYKTIFKVQSLKFFCYFSLKKKLCIQILFHFSLLVLYCKFCPFCDCIVKSIDFKLKSLLLWLEIIYGFYTDLKYL